jgi:hypothetical protein
VTGNDLGLTIRSAATDAAGSWRTLLALGRPRDWLWTAVPFLVGAWDVTRGVTPGLVLALLYLLLPVWLARHGASDLVSGRSGLAPATTWFAIAIVTVPLLLLVAAVAGPLAALCLAALTGLALADGLPPVAARERPGLDLAIVALAAFLLALSGPIVGGADPADWPWLAAIAFAAWSVGLTTVERIAAADGRPRSRDAGGTVSAIGPRMAGLLAVVDLVIATIATALIPGLGWLAALGVATYVLLPAMVVAARGGDRAAIAAARDAWSERRGLDILVGAWLVVLLAAHWRAVVLDPWTSAIVVIGVAAGWCLVNVVATRLATRRRAPRSQAIATPSLLIVVPCRDDADRLPACLAAIRAQTYADTSVVVVDVGSSDGSWDEAAAWIGQDDVIVAPPIPAGWEPRDWARRVGVDADDTELVLFVAPDTILAPIAARVLVEHLQAGQLALLSGVPRDLMPTLAERAVVPGFAMALFGLVPLWFPAISRGRPAPVAFADSGLLLVRREAYLATLGEGAVPTGRVGSHLADGRRIARAFVERGLRVGLIHGARLAGRRRAPSVDATVATWRRRTALGGRGNLAAAIAVAVAWAVAWIGPLALPAAAILADAPARIISLSLIPLGILVVTRVALAVSQRQSPLSVVWHPVTALVVLIGQAAGIVDRVRMTAPPEPLAGDDAHADALAGDDVTTAALGGAGLRADGHAADVAPGADAAPAAGPAPAAWPVRFDPDLDDPYGDLPEPIVPRD